MLRIVIAAEKCLGTSPPIKTETPTIAIDKSTAPTLGSNIPFLKNFL